MSITTLDPNTALVVIDLQKGIAAMNAGSLVAYFFGGVFLTNAVPHAVSGLTGHPLQTPFAKPPGRGLSSSRVNFFWGFANLVVGWALVARVGAFDLHEVWHVAALSVGSLAMGTVCAHQFGRFHGGNEPPRP